MALKSVSFIERVERLTIMMPEDTPSVPAYTYGNPERKTKGKTVIAHISDLHFTSITKHTSDEWKALTDDLASQQVDFLAVTGDLIDSSVGDNFRRNGVKSAFENVHDFLLNLCSELFIDPALALGVVPGNHDFRTKGVFSHTSKYRVLKSIKQHVIKPHFELFYDSFKTHYLPKLLPSLNCCFFTFDSNTTDIGLNFASGRITNEDLVEFASISKRIEKEHNNDWLSCFKVVLLHHHPMPIAATELNANFIESEGFHLLKNAGLFMTEMVRYKVDLILHGHKHYPALSKAIFPLEHEMEHTISVIAAGSASKRGIPHTSYNLITIYDFGQIKLERKIRKAANYGHAVYPTSLQSYEDARRVRYEKLARIVDAHIKGEKYKRVALIKDGSGDVINYEDYEKVQAYMCDEVDSIKTRYTSRSGFHRIPNFESGSNHINWEWDDKTSGRGTIYFNPPITKHPISFRVCTETHNAIYFNQEDRLSVTGNISSESITAKVREAFDLLLLKVSFPEHFTPTELWLEVYNQRNERDSTEEGYARNRLAIFDDDNSVILSLEKPLPGFTYKVMWKLPRDEAEELVLKARQKLKANDFTSSIEIKKRLLELRAADLYVLSNLEQRMHNLKGDINNISFGADDMEVLIHAHDKKRGGLVCVAAIGSTMSRNELNKRVIRVGDTIIGQAYKRREHIVLLSRINREVDHADFYDYDDGHTGVLSVALSYPFRAKIGFRVGVVTLATKSYTAPFLRLLDDSLHAESKAGLSTVLSMVTAWYAKSLLAALELRDLIPG